MTTHHPQEDPTTLDGSHSLWLVVRRGGNCTSYEFPPDSDRTVVAGASDRVQIHIARAAPIAFYIERVEHHLCITSCYPGAKLCVNARIMRGRQWITEPSRLEVAGELLELLVCDTPPTIPDQQTADDLTDAEPISSSELSSADTPDVFLAAFDDWFDATLLGAAINEELRPKPLEPSRRRAPTSPLKQVPVPPRPLRAAARTEPVCEHRVDPECARPSDSDCARPSDSDCARTLEFAAVRVTSLTEGLKTNSAGIRPELTMRIVPSLGELEADLAVTQPVPRTIELSPPARRSDHTQSARAPSANRAAPRVHSLRDALSLPIPRRRLMFLIGAAVGVVVPTPNAIDPSIPSDTAVDARSAPVDAPSLAASTANPETITSTASLPPNTLEAPPPAEAVTSSAASAAASVSLPLGSEPGSTPAVITGSK